MAANNYLFFVTTEEGDEIVWQGLTEIQASRMDRITRLNAPSNILRFGMKRDPNATYATKKERVLRGRLNK